MAADKHSDVRPFITGAKAAYETVVMAYADGDRRTLTNLLAPDVYEGFEAAIRARKDRGETTTTRFLAIDATHITAAELRGKTAYIALRFVSQLVSATRDRDGKVIEGDAVRVTNVSDVWVFARKVRSRDLNWKIVATEISG
jgi:predicted lipid-binding transport protein (Tim44 family)